MRRFTETGKAKDNWGGPPRTVTHRVIEFDNFTEFLKQAETERPGLRDRDRSSRNEGHEGSFYHHESWQEMLVKADRFQGRLPKMLTGLLFILLVWGLVIWAFAWWLISLLVNA